MTTDPESLLHEALDAVAQRDLAGADERLRGVLDAYAPSAPTHRAVLAVVRIIREQLGDVAGAAIDVQNAERENRFEAARFTYPPEARETYLGILDGFARAARSVNLNELARRVMMCGLDLLARAASETGDVASYAEALALLGSVSVDAGAFSYAHATSARLTDLEAGHPWDSAALLIRGRAWVGAGEYAWGMTALRDGLARSDAVPGEVDGLLALYGAALDVADLEEARRCRDRLVALVDPRGTSAEEIEARASEEPDPGRAMELYRQILAPSEPTLLKSSTVMRVAPRQIRLLMAHGDIEAAYQLAEFSYGVLHLLRGEMHPSISDMEELAATLELGLGHVEYALGALFAATNRDTRDAARQLTVGSPGQRTRLLRRFRRRSEAAVAIVLEHHAEDAARIGGVYALVTRQKGLHTAIQAEALKEFTHVRERDDRVRRLGEELREARTALAHHALSQGDLPDLVLRKESTEYELSARTGVRQGVMSAPNPANVIMTIPDHSAYVDYYEYTPLSPPGGPNRARRYCAFVVRAREMRFNAVDLGDASEIDELVRDFRRTIVGRAHPARDFAPSPTDEPTGPDCGERLRARLFDPLLPIVGDYRRLVITPDGALWTVPFDCLPASDGGQLIDRFTISFVSSSWSVMHFDSTVIHAEDAPPGGEPIVVGAPSYGEGRLAPLDGTREEAEAIARQLGVEPLLDDLASKAALLEADRPLLLHLATHGYFIEATSLDDLPELRTGLAFSGANDLGADGILTGEEVLSLDLHGTALAVLSACETGLGEPEHGEGPASLARAFHAAGVDVVIAGLWKVPDRETAELMSRFYELLSPPTDCAVALREAKLRLRRENPDPYVWGALACIGRTGSIATRNWVSRATPG